MERLEERLFTLESSQTYGEQNPRIPGGRFSTYYPSSGNLKRTDGRKVHQLDSEKIGPMKGAVTHSILP